MMTKAQTITFRQRERASDLSKVTTVEHRFNGRRGARRSSGASGRPRQLPSAEKSERVGLSIFVSPPWSFSWYEPWSRPEIANESNEPGTKDDAPPE